MKLEDTDELTGTREMKIKVPAKLHAKLWSIKIVEGQDIQDMVTEAVRAYLEDRDP